MSNEPTAFIFSKHGDSMGELELYNAIRKSDRPAEEKKRILADMKAQGKKYGFTFREYMLYDFEHKTEAEKYEFVSDYEHMHAVRQLNPDCIFELLCDKNKTHEMFSEYFRRDVQLIPAGDKAALVRFISAHNGFVMKLLDDYGGAGVKVFRPESVASAEETAEEILASCKEDFIVEELLTNCDELRALHPSSLNTMRIPTVTYQDRIEVIHPFIRVGTGTATVDSATFAHGILCAIDPATGVITAARDEEGTFYETHPDTGRQLKGFQIPRWQEAVALAKELASRLEGQRYVGWDITITTKGVLMIEGNADGMFCFQMPEMKGFRPEMERIFADLGLEYQPLP